MFEILYIILKPIIKCLDKTYLYIGEKRFSYHIFFCRTGNYVCNETWVNDFVILTISYDFVSYHFASYNFLMALCDSDIIVDIIYHFYSLKWIWHGLRHFWSSNHLMQSDWLDVNTNFICLLINAENGYIR